MKEKTDQEAELDAAAEERREDNEPVRSNMFQELENVKCGRADYYNASCGSEGEREGRSYYLLVGWNG